LVKLEIDLSGEPFKLCHPAVSSEHHPGVVSASDRLTEVVILRGWRQETGLKNGSIALFVGEADGGRSRSEEKSKSGTDLDKSEFFRV
jgi:hypothetical protein